MKRLDQTRTPPPPFTGRPPKRFTINRSGRRVLIGLTDLETREFDHVACIKSIAVQHIASKRWFELYLKHERSWNNRLAQAKTRKHG